MSRKDSRIVVDAACWEALVAVLDASSAFSLTRFVLKTDFVWLNWCWWQDYLKEGPQFFQTLTENQFFHLSNIQLPKPGWGYRIGQCGWSALWPLFFFFAPLSDYDVPQQGLLGELILIQQQIQRHEEEVRRAAAANSVRSPPQDPAPSTPPNPSPPPQTRKVKVPPHFEPPHPTNSSQGITAKKSEQDYIF